MYASPLESLHCHAVDPQCVSRKNLTILAVIPLLAGSANTTVAYIVFTIHCLVYLEIAPNEAVSRSAQNQVYTRGTAVAMAQRSRASISHY